MTEEDEEFNRIEREAKQRMEAVKDTIRYRDAFPKDYRLPKPWVGLTDDEVSTLIGNEIGFNSCCGWETEYTRAVEAKLKEKNER